MSMNNQPTAEELRKNWRLAPTFSEQAGLYLQLLAHPDCRWQDLLDGLGLPGVIGDTAALELHARLHVPAGACPCSDAAQWSAELAKAGVNANDWLRNG